jgi:hypothetical protein
MSDYTKITDFAAKDSMLTGNPLKEITGTAHDNEFNAISVAIATKYDSTDLGSSVQAYDAGLASIAGLTTAADRMIYTTASDTYAVATLTAAGRAILDDADAAAQRATLGLVIGTNVQAYDADIPTVAGTAAEITTGTETAVRSWAPDDLNAAITAMLPTSSALEAKTQSATTSGTSVTIGSIPSTVDFFKVIIDGVSTNGTNYPIIQLGDSGGIETSGYTGLYTNWSGTSSATGDSATFGGFPCNPTSGMAAGAATDAVLTFTRAASGSNKWLCEFGGQNTVTGAYHFRGFGAKTLSATLTQVRLTTIGGTDTFDAGGIALIY